MHPCPFQFVINLSCSQCVLTISSQLTTEDVCFFQDVIGAPNVIEDLSTLDHMNRDWMGKYKGQSKLALRPENTAQVSKILAYANTRRLAIVPQCGNTGLVGGSVPVHDEIILSLGRMDKILDFNPFNHVVTVQAGAILENVDNYLRDHGDIFPLDLGAKGSCQIGGNIATNAGGIRLIRYGSLHGNVLGLEVVLADGRILSHLNTMRKDNTALDLKQLFIGSEGLLGVITAASVQCPPKPKSIQVAIFAINSFDHVLDILNHARLELGEILSAFEYMDLHSLEVLWKVHPDRAEIYKRHSVFSEPSSYYLLVETHGSNEDHDKEKIQMFLEKMMTQQLILDGIVAQDLSQAKDLWFIRESIPEAIGRCGKVLKYDISIPIQEMDNLIQACRLRLVHNPHVQVISFGHLGDSNLHLNISENNYSMDTVDKLEPFIYEYVSQKRGSISAEHGIGVSKLPYLHLAKSKEHISIMKEFKHVLDPNGILNPYKVFPSTSI